MNELESYKEKIFDNIKRIDEKGVEFWYARGISRVLEYIEWRNFLKVLNNAKDVCKNSDNDRNC